MTIYDNILRLQQLSDGLYGSNAVEHAKEAREAIQSRAQAALDVVGAAGMFADILQEIKDQAATEEQRVVKLNDLLTRVIKEEADRMLGSAG